MRKKKAFKVCLCIISITSFLQAANILNPGFELEPNMPVHWNTEHDAFVTNNFKPHPTMGETTNWKIDLDVGLYAYEGNNFAVISNGDSSVSYGKLSQQITIQAGQVISGAYFFGTCDWVPYSDYASIKLLPTEGGGLNEIVLVSIGGNDVGAYSSTEGWVSFQSEPFDLTNAGSYVLECAVYDFSDMVLESYLAVDGFNIPEPSSIILLLAGFSCVRKKIVINT